MHVAPSVLLRRLLFACIPNVKLSTPVPFGGKIRYRARTHKGFLLRRVTDYPNERGIFRHYEEIVGPDAVVFDVGANIGLHAVPLALRATRGRVVAFEPDADNLRLLRENLDKNGVSARVQIVPKAVSDRVGTVRFWRDTVSSATGTIAPKAGNSGSHRRVGRAPVEVMVEATTIDAFAAENPGLVPTLVKIDVEGAETSVVEGMRQTALAHHPDIIIDGTPRACVALLLEWGYRLVEVQTRSPVLDAQGQIPSTIYATSRA